MHSTPEAMRLLLLSDETALWEQFPGGRWLGVQMAWKCCGVEVSH